MEIMCMTLILIWDKQSCFHFNILITISIICTLLYNIFFHIIFAKNCFTITVLSKIDFFNKNIYSTSFNQRIIFFKFNISNYISMFYFLLDIKHFFFKKHLLIFNKIVSYFKAKYNNIVMKLYI